MAAKKLKPTGDKIVILRDAKGKKVAIILREKKDKNA